jgi:hypothetical protein
MNFKYRHRSDASPVISFETLGLNSLSSDNEISFILLIPVVFIGITKAHGLVTQQDITKAIFTPSFYT